MPLFPQMIAAREPRRLVDCLGRLYNASIDADLDAQGRCRAVADSGGLEFSQGAGPRRFALDAPQEGSEMPPDPVIGV
jgi:hypothetical protein